MIRARNVLFQINPDPTFGRRLRTTRANGGSESKMLDTSSSRGCSSPILPSPSLFGGIKLRFGSFATGRSQPIRILSPRQQESRPDFNAVTSRTWFSSSVTKEYDHARSSEATPTPDKRAPWNKGKLTGAKPPVCSENLTPGVVMMKSAEHRVRTDDSSALNRARDRRIFIQ